ncbi:hypothetical protein [Singulisphaera sp. GP187]|uniref:hypothetical protein n=1 Tax=Singulisphaera sp. GP187 TaxID=1882752 RepID=UPI0011611FE3|nr:hypothetical protein [Singulisphaera sp. GP187]
MGVGEGVAARVGVERLAVAGAGLCANLAGPEIPLAPTTCELDPPEFEKGVGVCAAVPPRVAVPNADPATPPPPPRAAAPPCGAADPCLRGAP